MLRLKRNIFIQNCPVETNVKANSMGSRKWTKNEVLPGTAFFGRGGGGFVLV